MNSRALPLLFAIAIGALVQPSTAQTLVPTSLPTVTADNERWYLNGEPISYAGSLYYPSGAQVYFNSNEMVRSGFYIGVPLYTRTTLEPYSVVFVPLAGGRLQPYERPRTGELTGTAGSTPATLPTPPQTVPPMGLAAQAAAAPSQTTQMLPVQLQRPAVIEPQTPFDEGAPVRERDVSTTTGTAGAPLRPLHTQIGGRPQGANAMFIEYAGRRWYPAGAPQAVDTGRMTQLPPFRGFEVWGDGPDPSTIYIPVVEGSARAVAYTQTHDRQRVR